MGPHEEELVEGPLPRPEMDIRGVGYDAVHVEDNRPKAIDIQLDVFTDRRIVGHVVTRAER
jgi:hypothetical protein